MIQLVTGAGESGGRLKMLCDIFFFFFFSSRRRHTRCLSDWSSDVCSSDLEMNPATAPSSRNCHQELWRNPNVAEIRPSDPRDGEGRSTVTQPPSAVGTAA